MSFIDFLGAQKLDSVLHVIDTMSTSSNTRKESSWAFDIKKYLNGKHLLTRMGRSFFFSWLFILDISLIANLSDVAFGSLFLYFDLFFVIPNNFLKQYPESRRMSMYHCVLNNFQDDKGKGIKMTEKV